MCKVEVIPCSSQIYRNLQENFNIVDLYLQTVVSHNAQRNIKCFSRFQIYSYHRHIKCISRKALRKPDTCIVLPLLLIIELESFRSNLITWEMKLPHPPKSFQELSDLILKTNKQVYSFKNKRLYNYKFSKLGKNTVDYTWAISNEQDF